MKKQCFLIIIYNKIATTYHSSALWIILGTKVRQMAGQYFWTTVLLKSNVNRFPSPITEQWLKHHEKLFKLNIIYFPSRQHRYNIFTVTSEELFVYKSEVSAINIGYLNKNRDFVSLRNTEILLWRWESEQRKMLTISYKHNHDFLQ